MIGPTLRPRRPGSPRMRALTALAAAAALLGVSVVADAAFTLKVTPIPIVIAGGGTSTMVELSNEGKEPLRLEAEAFAWSQSAAGEDELTPTTEILVFPSVLTVEPGKTRKVRVGTQGGYGPAEKAFRVIFGEIPPNATSVTDGEVVKVIARVSVPIFVQPSGVAATLRLENLMATKDRVRLQARNSGRSHARIDRITVKFLGPNDQVLGTSEAPGWYVLPGKVRPFEIPVPPGAGCAGAARAVVTATTEDAGSPTATLDRPACAI